jgi:hypothetical protein
MANDLTWHDQFTGTRYRCSTVWLNRVRAHLVAALNVRLQNETDVRRAADEVATFWRKDYYAGLFPLRFGRRTEKGLFVDWPLNEREPTVQLDQERPLRQFTGEAGYRLEASAWPPILPDPLRGDQGWLQSDRLLIETALLNLLLRQQPSVTESTLHTARLAALLYPFQVELTDLPILQGEVRTLCQEWERLSAKTDTVERVLHMVNHLTGVQLDPQTAQLGLVLVEAQRIKNYVFETPGLNEIRGGSILLTTTTEELTRAVDQQLGPEVILRAGGSALTFLAPADDTLVEWPRRLRTTFFQHTGVAFPAVGTLQVSLHTLVNSVSDVMAQVHYALGVDRAQAELPRTVTYPFETRCALCQTRPAEEWDETDPEQGARPICSACRKKRKAGLLERKEELKALLTVLDILDPDDASYRPAQVGVCGNRVEEWLARELDDLVPPGVRRRLLGVVYGDGNNFGAVSIHLNDLALSLQWAARVDHVTRAAAALALGRATQWAAQLRGWQPSQSPILKKVPFQMLALGGDDLTLFAWAPVAVYFAAEFTRLTDLELWATSADRLRPNDHLHFSLGVLLTDEKTPVVKSVDFTRESLLNWAKKAVKPKQPDVKPDPTQWACGSIAMLYAERADKVPTDLDVYRQEIYLLGLGDQLRLCTTVRPYSALELCGLLAVAQKLVENNHLGRLERLVGAFYGARQDAFGGMLYYAYQKGRAARSQRAQADGATSATATDAEIPDNRWIEQIEAWLQRELAQQGVPLSEHLLIHYKLAEQQPQPEKWLFGIENPKGGAKGGATERRSPETRFSPLLDLLELAKLMR